MAQEFQQRGWSLRFSVPKEMGSFCWCECVRVCVRARAYGTQRATCKTGHLTLTASSEVGRIRSKRFGAWRTLLLKTARLYTRVRNTSLLSLQGDLFLGVNQRRVYSESQIEAH